MFRPVVAIIGFYHTTHDYST